MHSFVLDVVLRKFGYQGEVKHRFSSPKQIVKWSLLFKPLENTLRACFIYFKGNYDKHFPLVEFSYDNIYHSSKSMDPYEVLYGKICRYQFGWFEVGES